MSGQLSLSSVRDMAEMADAPQPWSIHPMGAFSTGAPKVSPALSSDSALLLAAKL